MSALGKHAQNSASNYGSIVVTNEDEQESLFDLPDDHDLESRKKSKLSLILGAIALLSAAALATLRNGSNHTTSADVPPKGIVDKVELLGEVHRKPWDTPLWFSQRRDHFEDFSYADTWQVSSAFSFHYITAICYLLLDCPGDARTYEWKNF